MAVSFKRLLKAFTYGICCAEGTATYYNVPSTLKKSQSAHVEAREIVGMWKEEER